MHFIPVDRHKLERLDMTAITKPAELFALLALWDYTVIATVFQCAIGQEVYKWLVFFHIMHWRNVFFSVPTGWTVCDGTKTNLYEAPAWKLLHVGKGLLQNPLSWVVYLPSSWFWMVSQCLCAIAPFFLIVKGDYVSLHYLLKESFINNVCSPTLPHM